MIRNNEAQVMEETIITDYFAEDKSNQQKTKIKITTISEIKPQQKNMVNTSGKFITAKTLHNKNLNLEDFYKKSRHYFIMTDSGKPVYSRYGDEIQNCGIFGMISAMITKFTTFISKDDSPEIINYIANENHLVVFNKKGHLYFIALSKKNDSISLLNSQLEYLYNQLLSILTQDRVERLEENPSHCNTAMSNTETLFEQIITYSSKSMVSILDSFPVLSLRSRSKLLEICEENRNEALLCIVMTQFAIVGISKADYIAFSPSDIILIQTLIFSSESLKHTESWVPVCLPGISVEGYLQIYSNFTEEKIGIIFITEYSDLDHFMIFKEQFQAINDSMLKENLIEKIIQSVPQPHHELENSELSDEQLLEEFISKLEMSSKTITNANTFDAKSRLSFHSNKTDFSIKNNQSINSKLDDNTKRDPFQNVIYGVCKHKALNQFFTINFDNLEQLTKDQKYLYREYIVLLDMLNTLTEEGKSEGKVNDYTLNNFFHYELGNEYTNVIQTSESFIFIGSFNFFYDYEKVNNILKDIFKYLKANETTYFIMVK